MASLTYLPRGKSSDRSSRGHADPLLDQTPRRVDLTPLELQLYRLISTISESRNPREFMEKLADAMGAYRISMYLLERPGLVHYLGLKRDNTGRYLPFTDNGAIPVIAGRALSSDQLIILIPKRRGSTEYAFTLIPDQFGYNTSPASIPSDQYSCAVPLRGPVGGNGNEAALGVMFLEGTKDDVRSSEFAGRVSIPKVSILIASAARLMYTRISDRFDYLTRLVRRPALIEQMTNFADLFLASRRSSMPDDTHGFNFALLMFDIDHFKRINDRYGHIVGDMVLTEFAEKLKISVRTTIRAYSEERRNEMLEANGIALSDPVARWGGEEFAIALPGVDRKTAAIIAERIRKNTAETRLPIDNGETLQLSCSIGLVDAESAYRPDMDSVKLLDRMISLADSALYRAKECGRNRIFSSE